jgi:hypothetical protein
MADKQLDNTSIATDAAELRMRRQKLALEVLLQRKQLRNYNKNQINLLSNPLTLAIVTGFITIMTSIFLEGKRAEFAQKLASESSNRSLQADLIKKAAEGDVDKSKKNLRFLSEAGLIPNYSDNITAYLKENEAPSFFPSSPVVSEQWPTTRPDVGYCFQRERQVQPDRLNSRFLARCFETEKLCLTQQNKEQGVLRKTKCELTSGLRDSPSWEGAGSGGILNSWYKYSYEIFPSPFPQF